MSNPEDKVLADIDALERDDIDELVDWELTGSTAAHRQRETLAWPVTTPDGVLVDYRNRQSVASYDNWIRSRQGRRRAA